MTDWRQEFEQANRAYIEVKAERDSARRERDEALATVAQLRADGIAQARRGTATYTGVTHDELIAIVRDYSKLLTEGSKVAPLTKQIGDDLAGICDTLEGLHEDGGRDVLTTAEHRKELGMCPDDGDHWWGECGPYECPTWREAAAEDAAEERRERGY